MAEPDLSADVRGQIFFGKWGWAAKDFGEVTFEKGESMKVVEQNGEWWKGRFADGRCGWFPAGRVRPQADASVVAQLEAALKKLDAKDAKDAKAPVASAAVAGEKPLAKKATLTATPAPTPSDDSSAATATAAAAAAAAGAATSGGKKDSLKRNAKPATLATSNSKSAVDVAADAARRSDAKPSTLKSTPSATAATTQSDSKRVPKVDTKATASGGDSLSSPRGEPMPDVVYARAKWPWKAKADTELTMEKGDLLRVVKKQGEWWKGKLANGQQGWFPAARVVEVPVDDSAEQLALDRAVNMPRGGAGGGGGGGGGGSSKSPRSGAKSPRDASDEKTKASARKPNESGVAADNKDGEPRFYYAKWGWSPNAPGELALAKGDVVYVTSRTAEWWKGRTTTDQSGWFPADRVRPVTDAKKLSEIKALYRKLAKKKEAAKASKAAGGGSSNSVKASATKSMTNEDIIDDLYDLVGDDDNDSIRASSAAGAPPVFEPLDDTGRPPTPPQPDDDVEAPRVPDDNGDDDDVNIDAMLDEVVMQKQPRSAARALTSDDDEVRVIAAVPPVAAKLDMSALDDLLTDLNPQSSKRGFGIAEENDFSARRKNDERERQERERREEEERAAAKERQRRADEQAALDALKQQREEKQREEKQREEKQREEKEREEKAAKLRADAQAKVREEKERREREQREREQRDREANERERRAAEAAAKAAAVLAEAEAAKRDAELQRDTLRRERDAMAVERARIERETRERVERETRERVERETRERVERETRERVEKEAREKFERDTRQRIERETRERLERERELEREKAEREKADRARIERETRERVERETRERVERETRQRIEREAKDKADADARAARSTQSRSTNVRVAPAAQVSSSSSSTSKRGGATDTSELDNVLSDLNELDGGQRELDDVLQDLNGQSRKSPRSKAGDADLDFGETLAKSDSGAIAKARASAYEPPPPSSSAPANNSRMSQYAASASASSSAAPAQRVAAAPPGMLPSTQAKVVEASDGRQVSLSGLERDVLTALQQLRRDPVRWANVIQERRVPFFDGTSMLLTSPSTGARLRFLTSEGRAAADDAARELREIARGLPLSELKLSAGMTKAAKKGLNEDSSFGYIREFGSFQGKVMECCAFQQETAEDIILQLLIDDGDDARTKRRMLLDRQFQYCGVAADDKRCIINLAGRFVDK